MSQINVVFDKFSRKATRIMGSHWSFIVALSLVILWGVSGPLFAYSQAWQMIINTGTTIITFLMVFIIQQSQNKDTKAVQLKLDEIIRANKEARNEFRNIEEMTEEDIDKLKKEIQTNEDKKL